MEMDKLVEDAAGAYGGGRTALNLRLKKKHLKNGNGIKWVTYGREDNRKGRMVDAITMRCPIV